MNRKSSSAFSRLQSGNHPNWVTVSRTMTAWAKTTATGDAEKGVPKRESTGAAAAASSSTSAPSGVDFYSQKNCAAQYNLLLKLVEPATPHGRRTKRYSVQWQCNGPRKLFM